MPDDDLALGPIPADPQDPAWHEARRTFIGASDAPAVLGLSPWATALDVWAEKHGLVEPFAGNLATELGHQLEDFIAGKWAALNPEGTVTNVRVTVRHPKHPHIAASVDRQVTGLHGGLQLLECKYVGPNTAWTWEDGPPDHVQVQCQVQMAVTGARTTHVCALIVDRVPEWKTWPIPRDDTAIAIIVAKLGAWWQHHVVQGARPDFDGDAAQVKETLGRIYHQADGAAVRLSGAGLGLIDDIKRSKALRKDLDAQIAAAKNELRAELGDSTEGYGDDNARPLVTWRPQGRTTYNTEDVFARKVEGFTGAEIETAIQVLVEVATTTTSRVLRIA